jgi:hypothetical protein
MGFSSPGTERDVMVDPGFGQCCKDLAAAMQQPPTSFFRVEENGVLYLTIGYAMTDRGPGWFDQAVLYCPFCGAQVQTADDIRRGAPGPIP